MMTHYGLALMLDPFHQLMGRQAAESTMIALCFFYGESIDL